LNQNIGHGSRTTYNFEQFETHSEFFNFPEDGTVWTISSALQDQWSSTDESCTYIDGIIKGCQHKYLSKSRNNSYVKTSENEFILTHYDSIM
jgi:hypothetical protein